VPIIVNDDKSRRFQKEGRKRPSFLFTESYLQQKKDLTSIQDLLHLPYRDHHPVSCEAQTRLDALIEML